MSNHEVLITCGWAFAVGFAAGSVITYFVYRWWRRRRRRLMYGE